MKCSWISYGQQSIPSAGRWAVFITMMHWLTSWHRKWTLARTQIQLQALRQSALSAHDDFRDHLIISVNALLSDLQARGIITLVERRNLAREWVKDYVRSRLPALYRERNAQAVDRLGYFLKVGS